MTCKIVIPMAFGKTTYTCDEVREQFDSWMERFRKLNGTDKIEALGMKDKRYAEYRREIEQFLCQCKCGLKKVPEVRD